MLPGHCKGQERGYWYTESEVKGQASTCFQL